MPADSLFEEHWTPRLRRAVEQALGAQSEFARIGLDPLLLLYGLFSLESGIPWNFLMKAGITTGLLQKELSKCSPAEHPVKSKSLLVTESAKAAFSRARQYASQLQHTYVGTEHLLLAILDDKGSAAEFLGRYLNREAAKAAVFKELTG